MANETGDPKCCGELMWRTLGGWKCLHCKTYRPLELSARSSGMSRTALQIAVDARRPSSTAELGIVYNGSRRSGKTEMQRRLNEDLAKGRVFGGPWPSYHPPKREGYSDEEWAAEAQMYGLDPHRLADAEVAAAEHRADADKERLLQHYAAGGFDYALAPGRICGKCNEPVAYRGSSNWIASCLCDTPKGREVRRLTLAESATLLMAEIERVVRAEQRLRDWEERWGLER